MVINFKQFFFLFCPVSYRKVKSKIIQVTRHTAVISSGFLKTFKVVKFNYVIMISSNFMQKNIYGY